MKQRRFIAAAVITAAALLSGCTSGGAASESAKPAVDVPLRATATAPLLSPAPAAAPVYVSIPHQAPVSSGILPGAEVDILRDGHLYGCTLGPAMRQTTTGKTGFLTAGHCAGTASVDGVVLGPVEEVADTHAECGCKSIPGELAGTAEDVGIIWTDAAETAGTIAGHPVAGAMSETELGALPEGTPVCALGSTTGSWCTDFYGADIFIGAGGGDHGDSGAAMFVVDDNGNATLIGIASDVGGGSILGRAMNRIHLVPVTAA